jgi:phenylacetate-CoA ligase
MFSKAKKYLTAHLLATLEPGKLAAISEAKTLKTFRRAALHIPAYRAYLNEMNLDPDRIKTISDFQASVPLTDKDRTFCLYAMEIKKLCLLGEIKDVRTIVSSSGHSGCFSYGLNTRKELKKHQEAIDFMLDRFFDVGKKKTLLINAQTSSWASCAPSRPPTTRRSSSARTPSSRPRSKRAPPRASSGATIGCTWSWAKRSSPKI